MHDYESMTMKRVQNWDILAALALVMFYEVYTGQYAVFSVHYAVILHTAYCSSMQCFIYSMQCAVFICNV